MRRRFPGSSALRASTPGLKSDDPSGASPLRDRQTGALGEESRAADLLRIDVMLKCVILDRAMVLTFDI